MLRKNKVKRTALVLGLIGQISLSQTALSQEAANPFVQEDQSVRQCLGLAVGARKARPSDLDELGIDRQGKDIDGIKAMATEWFLAGGNVQAQIDQVAGQVSEEFVQAIATVLEMPDATRLQWANGINSQLQQCELFAQTVSKDKCRLAVTVANPVPRIPINYYGPAKLCREEQALFASSEISERVKDDPQSVKEFQESKARGITLLKKYDALLKGQLIPQCGQFMDEYYDYRNNIMGKTPDMSNLDPAKNKILAHGIACSELEEQILSKMPE